MTRVSSYVVVSLCFVSIASFVIHQSSKTQSSVALTLNPNHSSLGFYNFSGSKTTPDHVQSFLNFINSASSFYKNDTKQRLDYISDKMNETIPSIYGFSVIQQTKGDIYDVNNTWFRCQSALYAGLTPGVDRVFPQYSYMFLAEPLSSDRVLISKMGQRGSGIRKNSQTSILNIILAVQTGDICKCEMARSRQISEQIQLTIGGKWNVFCSSDSDTFIANIYPRYNRYISTKPKNCYYIIYDNDYV